jgi:hypothetical protein
VGLSARLTLAAGACAAAALFGPSAVAESTEQLSAHIPEGWVNINRSTLASMSSSEWVPNDTAGDWEQKITLEAMEVEDLPDPIDFVLGLAESQDEACLEFAANSVFTGFENGYPTAVHMMECGENERTRKPLLTMVKAIRGNRAFYTITRIWRLEHPTSEIVGDDGTLPVDKGEVAAWAATLKRFKLCDSALDAHPCK